MSKLVEGDAKSSKIGSGEIAERIATVGTSESSVVSPKFPLPTPWADSSSTPSELDKKSLTFWQSTSQGNCIFIKHKSIISQYHFLGVSLRKEEKRSFRASGLEEGLSPHLRAAEGLSIKSTDKSSSVGSGLRFLYIRAFKRAEVFMNEGDKVIKKEVITKPGGLEDIEKIHLTPHKTLGKRGRF